MYAYGKFHDSQDESAYNATLEGCDEETGDVQDNGVWYGLLRDFDGYTGVIVSEDSSGFVSVAYFTSEPELLWEWEQIETDVDDWYNEPDPDWMN